MGIGAEACELLVTPVLKRSVANFREAPRDWNDIPDTCAALLDVCFPPALVGQGAADLLDLLASYEYPEMVMGHAAFGNPHFFILPHFGIEQEREKSFRSFGNLGSLCKAHSKARHPPSEF